MTIAEIRGKIIKGELTDEQVLKLLSELQLEALESEDFKAENEVRERLMLKKLLEYSMLFVILTATVLLSYWNKMDIVITISLLALITGYVLGRIR